jgi:hypothetical protein
MYRLGPMSACCRMRQLYNCKDSLKYDTHQDELTRSPIVVRSLIHQEINPEVKNFENLEQVLVGTVEHTSKTGARELLLPICPANHASTKLVAPQPLESRSNIKLHSMPLRRLPRASAYAQNNSITIAPSSSSLRHTCRYSL